MLEYSPELMEQINSMPNSFWYEHDVELIIRRDFLGENDPKPIMYLRDMAWKQELFESITLKSLNNVRSKLNITTQEEVMLGRNRYATEEQRVFVWLQERGHCAYCQVPVMTNKMHADHIEPFYNGGKTLLENLVCSCKKCNIAKGIADSLQFFEMISTDTINESMAIRNSLFESNRF